MRKDLFKFVNGSDDSFNKDSLIQPVEKINEWDEKKPLIFGEGLKEPDNFADEDSDEDRMSVAEQLSMELSDCQELVDYSNLFRNNVFFSGIILDIEEISETVDCGDEPVENLVALKFQVYHTNINAVCITDSQADIYLYPGYMDSPDILQEFEVGDLVGFSGHLKDDLELAELYDSDDAVDDYMSPVNILWTSAFMMHKNFLDAVGIDIPESEESEDPE